MKKTYLIILVMVFVFTSCSRETVQVPAGIVYTKLSNPNATAETVNLYNYMQRINGTKILSGQQESTLKEDPVTHVINPDYEMEYIFNVTGKLPAIRGFDFIDNDFTGVYSRAYDWHNKGGIVSICWHWGTPPHGKGYESSKNNPDTIFQNPNWWNDLYNEKTDLNKGFKELLNKAAETLSELQEDNIPVLWTPLQEFDGGWYWWSMGGKAEFIKLWQYMYDYFTNEKKLNNLIWVLGYSRNLKDGWNPGREYYDIAGAADFNEQKKSTMAPLYEKLTELVGNSVNSNANITTPLAIFQCGKLPDIAELEKLSGKSHAVDWLYFLNWHTSSLTVNNSADDLKYAYNSNYVITLDELPANF